MIILKSEVIFANRYLLQKQLGYGDYSEVWLARKPPATSILPA
jgi:hypothetical protein